MTDMVDRALADMDRQLGIEAESSGPAAEAAEAPAEGGTSEEATAEVAEPSAPEEGEQPRDEQGRFAKFEPGDATVAITKDGDQIVVPPELILGRFKNHDEVIKAYEELDRAWGRRGQEYGELKKELEELKSYLGREPEPPPQQITQDMVDEDPQAATLLAYEQGNEQALKAAFAAWKEYDPATAATWAATKVTEAQIEEVNTKWEERYKALEERVAPLAETAGQSAFDAAWQRLATSYPDAGQYAEAIVEAAQTSPEIVAQLKTGTPEETDRVLANLYKIAAFDAAKQADTLAAVKEKTVAEQEQETQAAKHAGFVASGSQRVETEQVSEGEQWARDNLDKHLVRYMARD